MRSFIKGFGIGFLIGAVITVFHTILAFRSQSLELAGFGLTLLSSGLIAGLKLGLIAGFVALLIKRLWFKTPLIEKKTEEEKKEVATVKKRSIGVIVVAVICILYSLWSVTSGLQGYIRTIEATRTQVTSALTVLPLLTILIDLGFLFGGFGILRLKIWARKLILWIAALEIPINIMGGIGIAKGMKMAANLGYPEYQSLKNLPESMFTVFTLVIILFGALPFILFYLFLIFFFTRPKVKEQFG